MAQRTVELTSVRRTDDPLVISRTDGGFRAFSPADPTNPYIVPERKSQSRTVTAPRSRSADALVQAHVYLVSEIARHLARKLPPSMDLDDLIGDGYVGLMNAARGFDPARGVSFKTFAQHRIRGAMLDGVRALDPRSRHMLGEYRAMEHAIAFLANLLRRLPTEDEIAERMGLKEETWRELRRNLHAAGYVLLIDSPRRATPAPDSLPGGKSDPEFSAAKAALCANLNDAVHAISARHRMVISLYYMSGLTMKEIAIRLGVNESRVSQLNKSAIAMLRSRISARRADFSL